MKKRILIEYEEQDYEGEPLDLFSYLRNEMDNAKIVAEIAESDVQADGSSMTTKESSTITGEIYVCSHCGSREVFSDAFASVNDPDDVRTYDSKHCEKCEGETSIVTESEYKLSQGETS